MECNKEEAVRAKEIAEKKMQNKDFVAARKIALKAQHLFPELENISQILAVCEIHCSAENRAGGTENDWYGILQVEVTADETAIKKQFRKLALLLHPDKNKFFGAEAAFKLVGEAHRVLMDPRKRLEHDMKRRAVRTTVVKCPPANRNSYGTSQPGVQGNYMSGTQSTGVAPPQQAMEPFWTTCPFCGMKYQYYRSIINRSVRCQSCLKPFIAYDMNIQGGTTGMNTTYQWNQPSFPRQKEVPSKNSQRTVPQSNPANFSFNPGSQSKAAEGDNADKGGQTKATAGNVGEVGSGAHKGKSFKKATRKRGRKAVEESSESCDTKSTDTEENATKVYNNLAKQNIGASGSRYPRRSVRQKQQVIYKEGASDDDLVNSPTSTRSKKEMESNVACDPASNTTDFGDKKDKEVKTRSAACEESLPNGREQVENTKKARSDLGGVEKTAQTSKAEEKPEVSLPSHSTSTSEANSDLGIAYSEPEFYDFDQDRTESKFKIDQIWALYDDREGMPRYYARIRKVYLKKFKVDYTWLESNPHDEDWVTWIENKLPIACGLFKQGGSDFSENVATFSHLVSWEKGSSRATYKIWPRKGDVWALFKDWDLRWNKDPEKYKKFEFEVVEVLSDYVEESGVEVAYLAKVKGFSSLFQRTKGLDSFQIPSRDLLRFSHRIPSHIMSGNERKGVVEGSFELDPASVPSKLDEVELSDNLDRLKKEADSLKETDSVEKQTPGPRVYSPRRMNGAYAKKSMVVDEGPCEGEKRTSLAGGKGSVDGASNNKRHREANSSKPVVDTKQGEKQSHGSSPAHVTNTFELPDSEFHNFESDKSIDKFQMGQFWALYSQEDGMPKYYARIEHVGSRGFSVRVKWLEACPESEEEIRWSERSPLGCGLFKLAKSITHDTAKTFSHRVQPNSTSLKTRFQIYPRKAEIWAMYKNWRSGSSFDVLVGCEYEIVEILGDDGYGRRVLLLGKVDGYSSVFKGAGIFKEIPRSEFLRFSHQVPAFHLTGEEGGKLRGYLELDPASLPAALLSKTGK